MPTPKKSIMKKVMSDQSTTLELSNGNILFPEFFVKVSVFSSEHSSSQYFDVSKEALSEDEEKRAFTPLTLERKSSRAIPFVNYFRDKAKYDRLHPSDWRDLSQCINNALENVKLWDHLWSTVGQFQKIKILSDLSDEDILELCNQELLARTLISLSDAFAFEDIEWFKKVFRWDSRLHKATRRPRNGQERDLRSLANQKIKENEQIFKEICSEVFFKVSNGDIDVIWQDEDQELLKFRTETTHGQVYGRDYQDSIMIISAVKKDGIYRYDSERMGWTYLRLR